MTNRPQSLTTINCFDLQPESIDNRTVAAISTDLRLDWDAAEDFANDIVVKELALRWSA